VRAIGKAALIAVLAAAPAAASGADDVTGSFQAMAVVETPQGTRQMGFTVVVSSPYTMEQAMSLKNVLVEGGQQALVNSIRGMSQGKFLLGAIEYSADLIVAEPDSKGVKYSVVTARPLKYEEVTDGSESLDYPFTVLVFTVPSFGSGDGKIFTRAALSVDADGKVHADQYKGRAGILKDVKPSNQSYP
jgi:hypothetical protein